MPSTFGFVGYLIHDLGFNEQALLNNLRDYLLKEGLTHQEIYNAGHAYNLDPVSYHDPMPLNQNIQAQPTARDAANPSGNPSSYNGTISTATGISMHDSDQVPGSQSDPHQDVSYGPGAGFNQSVSGMTYDNAAGNLVSTQYPPNNSSFPGPGYQNSLPPTTTQIPAFETASSPAAYGPTMTNPNASVPQNNNLSGVKYGTRVVAPRPPKPLPVATMKFTRQVVRASTLHFNQLITDQHLEIDDELHVPLAAIIRPDGSRQPVENEVAVMVV